MASQPDPLQRFVYPFPFKEGKHLVEPDDLHDYLRKWSYTNDGFFVLGNNGQWHGGIHFDENTERGLAQEDGVRCIADGEVIAYRIDDDVKYPVVEFDEGRAPYSTGFVLVRHRLQLPPAPRTAAAPAPQPAAQPETATQTAGDTVLQPEEPSLVFYSLYMHLRHWRAYKGDQYLVRPAFWEKPEHQRIVGDKAKDPRPSWGIANSGEEKKGLNVRKDGLGRGAVKIGWLPRGTRITLGDGDDKWRKIVAVTEGKMLHNPVEAPSEEAALGWVFVKELDELPPEPVLCREVYVLPTPQAIRAGEIVGHLGEYLRLEDVKLRSTLRPLVHLEIFVGEEISAFIRQSRKRDKELPANQKTLLKVEAGARLIQPGASDTILKAGTAFKAWGDNKGNASWVRVRHYVMEEMLLDRRTNPYDPKTGTYKDGRIYIEALNGNRRRVWRPQGIVWIERGHLSPNALTTVGQDLPAWSRCPLQLGGESEKTAFTQAWEVRKRHFCLIDEQNRRWWQVDGRGKGGKTVLGWVCEEGHEKVSRVSPWDWPGFEVMEPCRRTLREYFQWVLEGRLPKDWELLKKLYEVIDANRDLRLSKEEIRAAWRDRATSQFLSGLIVRYESEWGIPAAEWDTLDDLMSKFGPTRNWMAEKQRIIALQWWDKIRGKHGFPMSHEVYHFHPLAVIGNFHEFTTTVCRKCGCSLELTKEFLKKIAPNASDAFIDELIKCSIELFPRYGINTCNQITHLLAQAKKETTQFTAFRESLVYSRAKYGNGGLYPIGTRGRLYDMAPSAINAGFNRKGIAFSSVHNKYVWCDTHLIENDAGYGEHCFGSDLYPGKDYRGRGLLHLTHFDHYKKATEGTGLPVASQPELVENDHRVIIETGLWFWKWKSLSGIGRIQDVADDPTKTGNPSVRLITKLVTGSYNQGLIDRQQYKREISPIFNQIFSGCADVTDN